MNLEKIWHLRHVTYKTENSINKITVSEIIGQLQSTSTVKEDFSTNYPTDIQ